MTVVTRETATAWCVEQGVVGESPEGQGEKAPGVCESYIVEVIQIQKAMIFLSDVADFGFEVTGRMEEDTKVLWMDQERRSTERKVVAVKMAALKEAMIGVGKLEVPLAAIPAVIEMGCPSVTAKERTPVANMLKSLEQGLVTRYPSAILVLS